MSTNNGANWDTLRNQDTGDPGGFFGPSTSELEDLSAYAGETIVLRWRYSDTLQTPVGRYWHIDDVRIFTPQPEYDNAVKQAPATARRGDILTYTLFFSNSGTLTGSNTSLVDPIPDDTTFVPGSLSCSTGSCAYNDGQDQVEWNGALGIGAGISLTFAVQTSALCGDVVSNTATIQDPDAPFAYAFAAGTTMVPFPDVVQLWDLETDNGGLVGDGEWAWGDLAPSPDSPPAAHSGSKLWVTNLISDITVEDTTHSLTMTLAVPTDPRNNMVLSWWDWWHEDGNDRGEVTVDGFEVYQITSNQLNWVQHRTDLSAYMGQTIQIVFTYFANGNGDGGAGWYIDDLALQVESCTGVLLSPDQQSGACVLESVTYPLTIRNVSGAAETFDLTLMGHTWPTHLSQDQVTVNNGETVTVSLTVTAPAAAPLSEPDTVTVTVSSPSTGANDSAVIKTRGGIHWGQMAPAPIAAANTGFIEHDGQGYYLGITTTARYNPTNQEWTTLASRPNGGPGTSGDVCVGQNGSGDPILVVFPDPDSAFEIQRYDINGDSWSSVAAPAALRGLSLHDVASDRANNRCYLSGGNSSGLGVMPTPVTDFYRYNPAANTATQLANMMRARMGHASWLHDGKVCVGGGLDGLGVALSSTQCYNLAGNQWLAENATIGPLPYANALMADAVKLHEGEEQLWIAGGINIFNAMLDRTAHWNHNAMTWTQDAPLALQVTNLEGDMVDGEVYVAGGQANTPAGVRASAALQRHVQCPAVQALACNLPGVDFEEGIPAAWAVEGQGPAWTTTSDNGCGEENQTNSQGAAACADANSANQSFDTALVSNPFRLWGAEGALLFLSAAYEDTAAGQDTFDVDLWDGSQWTNLMSWDESHLPVDRSLNLSAYRDHEELRVRFRYQGNANAAFAQVDDVGLLCGGEPIMIVEPESISITVGMDQMLTETMTIYNAGPVSLTYSLIETTDMTPTVRSSVKSTVAAARRMAIPST